MFKRISIVILAAGLIVAASASAFRVQAAPVSVEAPNTNTTSSIDQPNLLVQVDSATLNNDESDGLLFMYEEEKLARDVYNALFALWGQPVFQNIAKSEQMHMNAVATLLVRYDLSVPAETAGVFTNPDLQTLYDDLMDMGRLSVLDALKAGVTIEEVDILDLLERQEQTSNADIQWVYSSLLNGSYNHLRSFTNLVEQMSGETYQPQFLTLEQYQAILSSTTGRGRNASAGSPASITAVGRGSSRGFRGGR